MKNNYEQTIRVRGNNIIISYDCENNQYTYSDNAAEIFATEFTNRSFWELINEENIIEKNDLKQLSSIFEDLIKSDKINAHFTMLRLKNVNKKYKWYSIGMVRAANIIVITISDIENEITNNNYLTMFQQDKLTGFLHKEAFYQEVERIREKNSDKFINGEYAIIYFDVLRFKAINDIFGMNEGDRLLVYISDAIKKVFGNNYLSCRLIADRFVIFTNITDIDLKEKINELLDLVGNVDLAFQVTCNVGVYIIEKEIPTVEAMVDRAVMAQSVIKGSYTDRINYYTESLRNEMLTEQEIIGMTSAAIAEKQFVAYYQPQYEHSTKRLVGAEALVRWQHPQRGLISPGVFIPIFERNGFITKLDLYMFEEACIYIRRCIDNNIALVPISTNFSRHDIFHPNFVENLENIRKKYDVPVKYLRIEITESCVIGSSSHVNEIVGKLHEYGYIVEMDDFGSGYSSLNVLKDIELDIIKLDMMFLSEKSDSNRGGTIVSSVVRMAKWLGLPVIAEGVETIEQADFLRSIGCDYIQGYLYSRPLPEAEFEQLIKESTLGMTTPKMSIIDTLNVCNFWDPKSQETLIFNNYVGGAAIFEYDGEKVELLRVNKKYLQEICMNMSEKDLIEADWMSFFNEGNKKIYIDMLERAIATSKEQECDTWRDMTSSCCGNEKMCIRCNVRLIGKSDSTYLFYALIRNVTVEKEKYNEILDSERRFKMASEHANIYYWEYNIATKEMHPCFRCMRDLGFPALLANYPESAIDMGVFPPDYADMYRDWHKQIENGVPQLEAVIPLTVGRIPFRVKYTTEFDENGHPVKAYGSATLIVDD